MALEGKKGEIMRSKTREAWLFGALMCAVVFVGGCGDGGGGASSSVAVTSPIGGETWRVDSSQQIAWIASNVANVRIEVSNDDGGTWANIVASTDATVGSYSWTVTGPASPDCLVRVSDVAAAPTAGQSDTTFSISPLFTDIGAGLVATRSGSLAWGDYDADGDLDLTVTGRDSLDNPSTKLYRNDTGVFVTVGTSLADVMPSTLAWGDYDGDGDLDIVLAGGPSGSGLAKVYSNDLGIFTDTSASLTGLEFNVPSVAWADYDNDGDLDLATAGRLAGGGQGCQLYRNDSASFSPTILLDGENYHVAAWGDYDNDGDLDLVLSASSFGAIVEAKIFANNGDGTFTDANAGLGQMQTHSSAWGDYDNDGDLDLAICAANTQGTPGSKIYRNDGGTFVNIGADLPQVYPGGAIVWGDYDNDGDLDIALAGGGLQHLARIYRNDGGDAFVDVGASIVGVRYCCLAWGDYDNDGDLDLAIMGQDDPGNNISTVYENGCSVPNTSPTAPIGLSESVSSGDATFSWQAATDAQTPQAGLTYNLRVGTTPGGNEIMSGMAITSPDARLIPAMGNVQHNTSWTLKGLDNGTYYWTVQAIDTAFAGGAWAPEEQVTVP